MELTNTQYEVYLNKIQDESIYQLIKKALEEYGTPEKMTDAIAVSDWLIFLLKNDKLIADNNYALFVDILRASALVHNLDYDRENDVFSKVFGIRVILEYLNISHDLQVNDTYLESIHQTVEGQLGKDHPVVALIPNPNSPGYHFALACSLYYNTGKTVPRA